MYKILPFLIALSLLSGCLAPKSFLEPKYRGLTYRDIQVPEHPVPVHLMVVGQTNGADNSRSTQYWKRQVERVLGASRVFEVSDQPGVGTLNITINNFADKGSAAGKGFMTGLTFGAVGSLVTDGYVMTVVYTPIGGNAYRRDYQHAIYTTIGNAKAPEGITPVSLSEAPSLVAEDMVLHFLKELQDYQRSAATKSNQASSANAPALGAGASATSRP